MKDKEYEYYDSIKDWSFDKFEIESDHVTNWDMYEILREVTDENSRVLDLGTGGGEKVLSSFPKYLREVLGTDYSEGMIETANRNLKLSGGSNISFRVMDNLAMDVEKEYFDVVVARNTVTDAKQIYEVLKPGGYLLIHGVDMYDCYELKRIFGRGQAVNDSRPISIVDYDAVLDAGFRKAELVPLHVREYFKNKELLKTFLLKVPILDDFSEEGLEEHVHRNDLEDEKLDQYIERNTEKGKIKLLRRYYGIVAQK